MNKKLNEIGILPPNEANVQNIGQLIQLLNDQHRNSDPRIEKVMVRAMDPIFQKEIISLITNLWRTKTRLIDPSSNEVKEEVKKEDLKKIARYLDSMLEGIKNMGFEIKDRTGETFSYGLTENVIASESQDGITSEIIIETLKPTIYWKDQIAQHGEVVIATPKTETN